MQKSELMHVMGFLDCIPAKLTKGKLWYVSYSIYDPNRQKMIRTCIKVNRIKDKRERVRYANRLITCINALLAQGLNPRHDRGGEATPEQLEEQQEVKSLLVNRPRPSTATHSTVKGEVTEDQVVQDIKQLLSHEFIDCGYRILTAYLKQDGYL